MILPRLGLFRSTPKSGPPKVHLVMIDGDICKSVCTRVVMKNGAQVTDRHIDCAGCADRGWCRNLELRRGAA